MKKDKVTRKKRRKELFQALDMEIREHKSSFAVYVILRALVVLCMILQIFNKNYENVFLCALTLVLFMVPSFLQVELKMELPSTLEIIILVFIFSAEILGEIQAYYIKFPYWDTVLHTLNGFLMAAIGFSLVDVLNRNEKVKLELSPVYMAIVAFCFSMTVGVLWEFFEFGMDSFFGFDMQKDTVIHTINSVMLDPAGGNKVATIKNITDVVVNGQPLGIGGYLDVGLHDTMIDLIVNFIGAVTFSFIGFFYVKYKGKGKGKIAGSFIPVLKDEKKDYLKLVQENQVEEGKTGKTNKAKEKKENTNE